MDKLVKDGKEIKFLGQNNIEFYPYNKSNNSFTKDSLIYQPSGTYDQYAKNIGKNCHVNKGDYFLSIDEDGIGSAIAYIGLNIDTSIIGVVHFPTFNEQTYEYEQQSPFNITGYKTIWSYQDAWLYVVAAGKDYDPNPIGQSAGNVNNDSSRAIAWQPFLVLPSAITIK